MRDNLNLNPHLLLAQLRHPNRCPNRLMIRHPLGKSLHHKSQRLIIQRKMITVDAEDLLPALPARVL